MRYGLEDIAWFAFLTTSRDPSSCNDIVGSEEFDIWSIAISDEMELL